MNNIIAKDGLFGFYKGVQANLMTTICGSSVLVTYDIIKFRFDKLMESYSKGTLHIINNFIRLLFKNYIF